MDSPYWKGPLPGVDVQRRLPVENMPGASRTAFRGRPKSVRLRPGIRVRLQPGMVFGISPESCSASPRNAVRLAPEYANAVERGHFAAVRQSPRQWSHPPSSQSGANHHGGEGLPTGSNRGALDGQLFHPVNQRGSRDADPEYRAKYAAWLKARE